MRRFFTLCMLLVVSMIAMLAACEETPNVEAPKPELKLLSNPVMLFEEQGGDGEIRYSLKNAAEGVVITAVADVEWVSDIVVAETIKFVVAANDVEEVRSAQIAVSYDTLEFVVDIRQAAKKPEPEQPEDPETPEQPEDPETPEQPEDPETPEQPEDPEAPEQPEDPETPEQPEDPETPEQPEDPETPEQPEDPETPEQPEDPETPEQPENPETPEQPEDPETPEQPNPEPNPEPEPEPEPEQPKPELKILSEQVLNFGAEGSLYEVKYKVENPVEGASVKAVADVEWVTNIVVVEAEETIKFEVLANDVAKARTAKLYVQYSTRVRELEIRQEAGQPAPEPDPTPDPEPEPTPDPDPLPDGYDVALRATCLSGEYYGQNSGVYNYNIILSDVKCSHWNDIVQPNSFFYCFDLYSKTKSNTLPTGVYKADLQSSAKANTFDANGSRCVETDANGELRSMFGYESGTLTVSENKIVGEFELGNGEKHYIIYEGSLTLSYE